MSENKKQTSDKQQNGNDFIADVIGRLIDFAVENNKLKNRDRVFLSINNDNTIIEVYEADINEKNINYVGCYRINDL